MLIKKTEHFLQYLNFILLFIFSFLLFFRPIEIGDIWWHLATGRWIFENQQFPVVDVFSPIEQKAPWILTQSIGSCIYYLVHFMGDILGLKIFRLCLFIFVIGLFLIRSKKKLPPALLLLLAILLSFALGTRIVLRPLVFNFIFIQLFLMILLDHQKGLLHKGIYILPLFSILWMNIHLGGFIYGFLLLGIFGGAYCVHYYNLKTDRYAPIDEVHQYKNKIKDILIVICGHACALLVNPFGLKGSLYPFKELIEKQYLSDKVFELLSPLYIFSWQGIWVHILLVLVVYCLIKNRKFNFTYILLFIFSFFMFLFANRGSVFFALCSIYIIAEIAETGSLNKPWNNLKFERCLVCLIYAFVGIFLLIKINHLYNRKIYSSGQVIRELYVTLDPRTPVKNVDILKKYNMKGNIFNWDGYGGYLLWTGYPDFKPMLDGRQVNNAIFDDYWKVTGNPQKFWTAVEHKYKFTIALLDANYLTYRMNILDYLIKDPDWKIISLVGSSVLLVKDNEFVLPENLSNFEQQLSNIKIPALNNIEKKFKSYRQTNIVYNKELEEGIFLFARGFIGAGLTRLIHVNEQIDDPKAKHILGLAVSEILHNKM